MPTDARSRLTAVVLAVLVTFVACSSRSPSGERTGGGVGTHEPAATLANLSSLKQLVQRFDDEKDVPRLILLLSPT